MAIHMPPSENLPGHMVGYTFYLCCLLIIISGTLDPEIAQHIRPGTLRARFGQNKVKNAVHCTDLADDTQLELEFFFKLLQ